MSWALDGFAGGFSESRALVCVPAVFWCPGGIPGVLWCLECFVVSQVLFGCPDRFLVSQALLRVLGVFRWCFLMSRVVF